MAIKMYINADELAKVNDVYTKAQTDTMLNSKADTSDLADKQDVLVSGTNIKTINNESLLGSGNINISSGSSDVVIDIGTFHISKTATDIVNSLTSQQKTDIVDTSVNNVYIKVKNSIVNENALLKRTKYRIIDPDNNPNSENTEVCFVGSVVSDDYNQYNERYVLYYVIDYSDYPSSTTEKALLYYTTLGSVNEIVANNSSIPMGNSLPFSNEFDYDFGNGYIKLTADYVLSGTISNYDSIQDTDAIATMVAHKPIIVNGKRFEYQDASGFHLRYFNASLNGTLIHLTIMDYNTDRNEVIFTEQDVNDGMTYTTTEPSAPNTNGLMKLVVLNAQPTTKYAGWLYYITQ